MPIKTVPLLKPRAVLPGTTLAVISPASYPQVEKVERAIAALEGQGYRVKRGEHFLSRKQPYFAGSAEVRLADLHTAFADPEVAGILCSRGGYGSNYLLEGLDLELVRANPKPLLGYSDLTTLQTWMLDQVGLVAFQGPMLSGDFARENGVVYSILNKILSGECVAYGA